MRKFEDDDVYAFNLLLRDVTSAIVFVFPASCAVRALALCTWSRIARALNR